MIIPNMIQNKNIKGILFDLDGVMYTGDKLIPGSKEAIIYAKEAGIKTRFLTNTTRRSFGELLASLANFALPIERHELITSPRAADMYLRRRNLSTCFMIMKDSLREEFTAVKHNNIDPQAVVIGDIEKDWNYDILNRAFLHLMNGAELISLHKGRFWRDDEGLRIDLGAFTAALEFASGKEAVVTGKPSPDFFDIAANDMELSNDEVIMIGDDINSDIGGAQQCGIRGVLVKTGKYLPEVAKASSVDPFLTIESIAELPKYLREISER